MRQYPATDLSLEEAGEQEIESGLAIMNEVMSLDITLDQWHWMRQSCTYRAGWMSRASKDGVMVGVMACYPRRLFTGNGRDTGLLCGQLCVRNRTGMRKRGAGVGVAVWTEHYALRECDIPLMIGITGQRLYDTYYRKLLGYTRRPLAMSQFHYYDCRPLLRELCEQFGRSGLRFEGTVRVAFRDTTGLFCLLRCSGHTAVTDSPVSTDEADMEISGDVWPLLRLVTRDKSRKAALLSVLRGRARLRRWISHPVKTYRFIRLLWDLWKHGRQEQHRDHRSRKK